MADFREGHHLDQEETNKESISQPGSRGPPIEDEEDEDIEDAADLDQWAAPLDEGRENEVPDIADIHMDEEERCALNDCLQDEEVLWQDTFEVPFGGKADAPVRNMGWPDYVDYRDVINTSGKPNVWHPFKSKMEWEFTRWAKMRGP